MGNMKKIVGIVLCAALLFPSSSQVQAKKNKNKSYWPKMTEEITANAAILMDVDTGTILYKKNINEKYYPASITKILTTLIAIENSTMDETVTFSENAIYKTEGSGIWRDIGEKMTMEECLYAIMLESANECAYAVAEHIAGKYEDFMDMMNEKARELGCKNSHFNNPHGLTDEKHYVTAKDMAIISREAYQNETFRLLCGTKRYTIPPTNKHDEPTYLSNHHKMFNVVQGETAYLYEYCTGGKTGYTIAAGNTLVTFAQKDGMSLVVVILNGDSPAYWNETRALFDFGFENFDMYNVAENVQTDEKYENAGYDVLNTNGPYAEIDPQAKIVLPKTVDFSKAEMEISYDDLSEGAIAQLNYSYGNHKVGTANIIQANTEIEKSEMNTDISSTDIDKMDNGESSVEYATGLDDNEKFSFTLPSKVISLVNKAKNFIGRISKTYPLVLIGIAAGIVLVVLAVVYCLSNAYVIRQKIANFKSDRRARKQYTIIKDSTNNRRRRRKRR